MPSGRQSDAVRHKFQQALESSNAFGRITQILAKTKSDETFLRCVEFCSDRAYGKPTQVNENFNHNEDNRPSTESLIETIRALREELKSLREGAGVEAKQ